MRDERVPWVVTALWAGGGLVLGRWVSMEPFSSVFTPWDLAAGAAAAGLGAAAARLRVGQGAAPLGIVAASLPAWAAWGEWVAVPAIPLPWKLACAALAVLALGRLVLAVLRGSRVVDPSWAVPLVALALPASLVAARVHRAGLLVLPLAALLAALPLRWRPRLHPAFSCAGVALLLLVTSQAEWPRSGSRMRIAEAAPAPEGPGVVLVVLDTLRRDHLALYGYERDPMPRLEHFARDALVFDAAWSTSSWTLPSHASMFTGLPPRSHGAHGYRGEARTGNAHPLPDAVDTLAERVRRHGAATGAVVSNHFYLSPRFGLDAGFETYWVPSPRRGLVVPGLDALAHSFDPHGVERVRWAYYRAHEITDRALQWLGAHGDRSFFLFVNYMDAHAPNRAPPTAAAPLEAESTPAGARFELEQVMEGQPLPAAVHRHLVNEYDRELSRLDTQLGRLLDALEAPPLAGRTTVIVTSDHGEHFGEHALVDHSRDLWEEGLAVPLVIRGPGVTPGRRADPVSITSLHGTVLERLGAEGGAGSLLGPAPPAVVAEWYASEHSAHLDPRYGGRFDRDVRVYREGAHKLRRTARGAVSVYDLGRDPGEAADLAASDPALRARLERGLDAWLAAHPPARERDAGSAPPIDPEHLEQLRALGYAE